MKDYTRVYLIRHGHLVNSHTGVYNGHTDIELSPEGLTQTISVAESFRDKSISAIYSSDLKRSCEGATMIASSLGLEIISTKAFRERDFGLWEGLTPDEIQSKYSDLWKNWMIDPAGTCPPEGEPLSDMQKRIWKELEIILKTHKGKEVILFTHAGVNRVILCHALNLGIENCFRLQQDFCGISIVDFFETTAVVRLMNGSAGM